MEVPPEITFRNLDPSDAVKTRIRQEIEKLEKLFDRVIACRVMVEVPHQRQQSGNPYHVRIELSVPTQELVVSRDPADRRIRESLNASITHAFEEMGRQLREYAERLGGG
jgi:ribosomal subunit interface protein